MLTTTVRFCCHLDSRAFAEVFGVMCNRSMVKCTVVHGMKNGEPYEWNILELESGTTATHNTVAAGSYEVGICLDYVSANLISEGSPMAFHYTSEDVITMTSPLGIFSDAQNVENAQKLYDFILSKEGQELLVANNLVSVRDDVEMKVDTSSIAAINLPVDFNDLADYEFDDAWEINFAAEYRFNKMIAVSLGGFYTDIGSKKKEGGNSFYNPYLDSFTYCGGFELTFFDDLTIDVGGFYVQYFSETYQNVKLEKKIFEGAISVTYRFL